MIFKNLKKKYFKDFDKNEFDKSVKGFTVVESLVAIVILIFSIMAPLSLAMQVVKYSKVAIQKMEATYLAEEGVEMVYNLKKSAEIYCSDSSEDRCNQDYFNDFFLDQTSLVSERVIDPLCYSKNFFGKNNYCNFDLSNIVYDQNTKRSLLKNINTENKYIQKLDNDIAIASNVNSIYKRSINITPYDNNVDYENYGKYHSAMVTVIVCINESSDCTENSDSKIILQNIVSR